MSNYKGIHHLAMVTGDLDKTIRFWRDLLRMKMIGTFGKAEYKQYFFEISLNSAISFFQWPDVKPIHEKDAGRMQSGQIVFDHVSIEVESEDELWKIKERLEYANEWVSEVIDHGIILSIYTFDPNGISLEFTYQKEKESLQEKQQLFDSNPSNISKEGIDPQGKLYPDNPNPTDREKRKTYKGLIKDYMK